jgi:hypothetical protein
MAITRGPLHSDIARGSIAQQLTFRHTKGQSTCRKIGRSTRPLSETQQLHHAAFSMLAAAWSNASTEDKATWQPLALTYDASNYAPYLRFNFARIAAGESTTTVYPPITPIIPDAIISAGSPAPNPDCTGDYQIIGQQAGQSIYSRLPDYDYVLSFTPYHNTWTLTRLTPASPYVQWSKAFVTTPAGSYDPLTNSTGIAIVTL